MTRIIDSHAHVFPNLFRPDLFDKLALTRHIETIRDHVRDWWRPLSSSMHYTQTILRHLPEPARRRADQLGGIAPLFGLLVESTASDLAKSMEQNGVDAALVIAHPPIITNEFVMELFAQDPRFIPVVNIPKDSAKPAAQLRSLVKHGAKALKIHPAADGEGANSPRYRKLLHAAANLGIPVIIHTGCLNSHVLYKDPEQGRAERFAPWFKAYPDTQFVLAHMNIHEPNVAFDLAEEHFNVSMDTSWQPAEVIGEAVRRVGADRVMFGTDWPFVGTNISIGLSRIRECLSAGTLNAEQSRLILGENAARLFGLSQPVPTEQEEAHAE